MSSERQEDLNLEDHLEKSKKTAAWVADQLNGLRIPNLPHDMRLQLATACQHLAIEHAQAIIALVDNELYGSALALQRPLFETAVRGVWLRYSATEEQVVEAGQDKFPLQKEMIENIESLRILNEHWWTRLCSYTHSGSQQILARISDSGLRSNYEYDEITTALLWSDMVRLFSAVELALAAKNESLAKAFLELMGRDRNDPEG